MSVIPTPSGSAVSRLSRRSAGALLVAALAVGGVSAVAAGPAGAATTTPLIGTFHLTSGAQTSATAAVTGSYFRMLQPGGTVAAGPYLANANSTLKDTTYTPFVAGSSGGLITGVDQPQPSPGFDSKGNSLAKLIIKPTPFFGINFSVDTNATDLQTNTATPAPSISVDSSGNLSGNLEAFDASWNNQEFNQGSPKPDGTHPGLTANPTGSYNATTGAYTLNWASQIVGGPFNNFTGVWHFTGTFTPTTPVPKVTSLNAKTGSAAGGNSVTIAGSGLAAATAVHFGTAAATITSDTATSIKAIAPAGSGAVSVTVTTAGGTSAATTATTYTYAVPKVTSLNPKTGSAFGGTAVTIAGSGLDHATSVRFGSALATITSDTATSIKVTTPAGSGVVAVTVTTGGGTSATSSATNYTYKPA